MAKKSSKKQVSEQEGVMVEDGFVEGEAYPNCEGEPCANVSGEETPTSEESEKMAESPVEQALAEAAEWKDKYLRMAAEFDNYRKRTLKEKMDLISAGGEDVVKAILPVLDDFELALQAMEQSTDIHSVREGVVLISQKLNDTLRAKGVTEIEAVGMPLDTDLHEAVAKFPVEDDRKGKIIDVVQKGYTL